jgi:hypothetical protein
MDATNGRMSENLEQLVVELAQEVRHRYFGKYRGIVRDVNDPESLGRIVAQVPSVLGDEDSPWALPAVPFAGASHGLVLLPQPGDGVWIEFEAGNAARPIWTGCWWGSGEMPSPGGPDERTLVTPQGLKVVLDDAGRKLQLVHPGGAEITLTETDITLSVTGAKIVLSAAGISMNDGAYTVR